MTDYERGYEQGKADAAKKMHPEMRKMWEDYFDKCFKEYDKHLRPWTKLTVREIEWCFDDANNDLIGAARNIEFKLKEKNT